jgi:hypothetical protein
MNNSLYHSDYNTLHFVAYNFQKNPKYNFTDIYDNWFSERNDAWAYNPDYIQKIQKGDPLIDQIIVSGLSNIELDIYECSTSTMIDTIQYNPVNVDIPRPNILLEANIDMDSYPDGVYYFVMRIGEFIASISEKIYLKEKWDGTILIESSNSIDKIGVIFSTGFRSVLRVEGLVKKQQPNLINKDTAIEDTGDSELLYSLLARKRTIRFGTAYGLPDYLYLKISLSLLLDDLNIEGVGYVILEDEKITPSADIDGHPLYYYNIELNIKENVTGLSITDSKNTRTRGVVIVTDATAFGLPVGSLISINLDNMP